MSLIATTSTIFGLHKTALPIINTILNNWKIIVIATMFAIIVYQNTFDSRVFFWADTIPYLQNVIDDQADQLDGVIDANNLLSNAVVDTNLQIQEWKAVSDALESKNRLLESTLENVRNITKTQVRDILNAPTPKSCKAALDFLRDSIPLLQDAP